MAGPDPPSAILDATYHQATRNDRNYRFAANKIVLDRRDELSSIKERAKHEQERVSQIPATAQAAPVTSLETSDNAVPVTPEQSTYTIALLCSRSKNLHLPKAPGPVRTTENSLEATLVTIPKPPQAPRPTVTENVATQFTMGILPPSLPEPDIDVPSTTKPTEAHTNVSMAPAVTSPIIQGYLLLS
jgi:hypothetical protein